MTILMTRTETPQVVKGFLDELHLLDLTKQVSQGAASDDVLATVNQMVVALSEYISSDMPTVNDPVKGIRDAATALKLTSIIRERAIFRLWLALRYRDENGLPAWTGMYTEEGDEILTQEDLLETFAKSVNTSRSWIYNRIGTFDTMRALGFSDEEIFNLSLRFPNTVKTVIENTIVREHGEVTGFTPTAKAVISRFMDKDSADAFETYVKAGELDRAAEIIRPALGDMITTMNTFDHSKDANKFFNDEVVFLPKVSYTWVDGGTIEMTMVVYDGDKNAYTYTIPIIIDDSNPPRELISRLLDDLHVAGRTVIKEQLDNYPTMVYTPNIIN